MTDHKGWHHRGYLPHFDTAEAPQHVVFRTLGSLPATFVRSLPDDGPTRRRMIDRALDRRSEERTLSDFRAAGIVETTLLHFDAERYDLLAWCVMPNHVHVVAAWKVGWAMGDTIRSWKTFSASRINRTTGHVGPFWARDHFDRVVRDQHDLDRTIAYVEANPVVAGLAGSAEEWRFSSASRRGQTQRA